MNKIRQFIKLSGIIQRSWLNPLFLALFPAVLIIWLQPIQFTPLVFELYQVSQDLMIFYDDLENDGKAERFLYGNEKTEGHAHIRYYNDKDQYIGQYNFTFQKVETRAGIKPYSHDFNNDGVKDLVFVSQHSDSLFLDVFDYKNEKGMINSRFITTVGGYNEQHTDHNIYWLGCYNANSDSIPELYFSVSAGFALYPRRIFRYDFVNDSLIASINTGAGDLTGEIFVKNDSMLLVCGSMAHGNIPNNYPFPYHDTTTWLFGFDKNLEFAFPPKSYGIYPGGIADPIFKDGCIYYLFGSNNAQPENKLFKMNWQGEILDSMIFDFYISKSFSTIKTRDKIQYHIENENDRKYLLFDIKNFRIKENKVLKIAPESTILYQNDLNNNGKKELLVAANLTKQVFLYNHKLRKQNILEIGDYIKVVTSNYFSDKGFGYLIINTENEAFTFRYQENPYYYLKYPIYFGIYLVSVLFVALILLFQNRRIKKQKVMEEQLADLQLQNLRNQLDPHFTFNVLNSVGNAIYKQDKEGAYDLFQRFTRIIRSSLMSSEKVFRPLNEELQFTQDYLEFQKLRFKNRFNYAIKIEKGIDTQTIRIPKMLIQGFAENAVKHAFYGVGYTGQITIHVFRENQKLNVMIEDDGIGINRSKQLKITSGTQKGLDVLKEQVKQINRIYKTLYSIQIEDKKFSNTKTSGTVVKIGFPFKTIK